MYLIRKIVLVFAIVLVSVSAIGASSIKRSPRAFPDGLLFGTATASYQIEGGWDADGKTENIWDRLSHTEPCAIKNCDTGDVAVDSYNNIERDVAMLDNLGVDFYRFSISWTRVLPTSFPDQINEAGVAYYNNLINALLEKNIQPVVTLFHWDLPQKLQEMGGFTTPYIVEWFTDYARVLFRLFGDRVKTWFTFNEPFQICYGGYADLDFAPMLNISGVADYLCARYLLLANAKVWHMYNDEFRASQGGTIGITIQVTSNEPESEAQEQAARDLDEFEWGIYAHPIFTQEGNFPQALRERIAAKSAAQNFGRSRLPEFTQEEIDLIKGTSDFFGLNHYTSNIVYRNASTLGVNPVPSTQDDRELGVYKLPEWEAAETGWPWVVPKGLQNVLNRIRLAYDNPPVYIAENGFATVEGLDDPGRVNYYRTYLDALLDAIDDGCDVKAYTAWSLMDNFEWLQGYSARFGLHEVDFESPARTTTPRKSALVYKEILRTRTLDFDYEPDLISEVSEPPFNISSATPYNILVASIITIASCLVWMFIS